MCIILGQNVPSNPELFLGPVRWQTSQVQDLSGGGPVRCRTSQVVDLSGGRPVRWWTCQVVDLSGHPSKKFIPDHILNQPDFNLTIQP